MPPQGSRREEIMARGESSGGLGKHSLGRYLAIVLAAIVLALPAGADQSGSVTLAPNAFVDLDAGAVSNRGGDILWSGAVANESHEPTSRNVYAQWHGWKRYRGLPGFCERARTDIEFDEQGGAGIRHASAGRNGNLEQRLGQRFCPDHRLRRRARRQVLLLRSNERRAGNSRYRQLSCWPCAQVPGR